MQVHTSNGIEEVNFNKILAKLASYATDLHKLVDVSLVAQKTIERMVDGISTEELDNLSAGIAASLSTIHPDYSKLGARILMSRLHKKLDIPNRTFFENLTRLYDHEILGEKSTRVSEQVYRFVEANQVFFNELVDYEKDFSEYDYAAIQSFFKRGLEHINGEIAEAPSQMLLRVAIGLNSFNPRSERELSEFTRQTGVKTQPSWIEKMTDEERREQITIYYEQLSTRKISLPGPILLHAGSKYNQMASCYLQYIGDSLVGDEYNETGVVGGIMKGMTQLAHQSKFGGGNAINIHDLRGAGSPIRKTNGNSNGILPFMKMFDAVIGAVNQSGKRAGTCAVYLEPWHIDILDYLDAGNHFTIEEKRCKNLFYGLWMNDLFFERFVQDKADAKWTLFDPGVIAMHLDKPLSEYYGDEFKQKYLELEALGVGKTIPLMEIWSRVCNLFQTTGMPYLLNKDAINLKSNQQNIGTIKSSNLCTEIALVNNNEETAVCVLSSVCVSRFVDRNTKTIDYEGIIETARIATRHLNNVIDLQYYPTPETRNSCLMRRAIGVGVQGLADVFALMGESFVSDNAKQINKKIYEAVYYGCLLESMELAKVDGAYHGFVGSPLSKGELQFNMWGMSDKDTFLGAEKWDALRKEIKKHGVRNSEVTALAPTASSSVRMGNNEMHEPFTRNVFVRSTIAGSIQMMNRHLVEELVALDLWTQEISNAIIMNDGSVQGIDEIPLEIQDRYRTVYEYGWQDLIDMMADRSPFVSQTSSYNHYTTYEESGPTAFTQKAIYAWRKGLKTISYYQHTESATNAKKELGGHTVSKQKPVAEETPIEEKIQEEVKTKPRWNPDNVVKVAVPVQTIGEVCEDCQA
jgi:ribonucleoside-diphosphate reductase alpha chain